MANYETGYPTTANVVNHQAYKLGCDLLDLQDRLLTRNKNRQVRIALELDCGGPSLFFLSYELEDVVNGSVQSPAQVAVVLNKVQGWLRVLENVATRIGV